MDSYSLWPVVECVAVVYVHFEDSRDLHKLLVITQILDLPMSTACPCELIKLDLLSTIGISQKSSVNCFLKLILV